MLLPKNEESFWHDYSNNWEFLKLKKDISVDACIIGGGLSGISTAYLLKKAGFKVAVIEKGKIGEGTSGNTTGKVTSQHGAIYQTLLENRGQEIAGLYADANQSAISKIGKVIKDVGIDCDWQRRDNYVFSEEWDQIGKLKKEAETAKQLGLPASFTTRTELPFDVKSAVKFSNQATFHVQKYLLALARSINDGQENYVFEKTRALGIRDDKGLIFTRGGKIAAKYVVIATNVPFFPLFARGNYCLLEYPQKSYVVAGYTARQINGMYINTSSPVRSILPVRKGRKTLLLIAGENHIPKSLVDTTGKYQRLARFAKENFGVRSIEYRWSARDYLAYDDTPIVGRLYPWSKNTFVATAFMKWGLTNTMAAAIILRDLITGQPNLWTKAFASNRMSTIGSIPRVFKEYISR